MSTPTHEITVLPGDSLSTAPGSITAQDDRAMPVSVNGRGFLVDLSDDLSIYHRFQRASVNLLNTQQAQSSGDLAQVPPEVWRRSVESWESGAGQSRFDRDASLPNRYAESVNINVWDPWRISLLNETSLVQALGSGRSFLTTVGPGQLFAGVGTDGYWWTNVDLAPTHMTFTNTIVDACSDGQALYVLDSTGAVTRWTDDSTSTAFATITSPTSGRMLLRYIKGFLVVANGNVLLDISTGTPATIYTHPLDGHTWVDACEGQNYGYLLGGMGDKWNLYKIPVKNDGTTLDPPSVAGPIPEGEVAYSCASYLGYVMVGLAGGWRFGVPSGDGSVGLGRLIETAAPVYCFEGQGRFVWYGLSAGSLDGVTVDASGLGRADLTNFTAPNTPAYASDLQTASTGTVRAATTFGASATKRGVRAFTVDGVGVYFEQDTLAASGWLRQGAMTFGASDPKMGLYAQVYHDAIVGGTIQIEAKYDDKAWKVIAHDAGAEAVSMGNITLNESFNLVDFRLTLTRDPDATFRGPAVTRLEARALPVPGRATEWRIPLLLDETTSYENIVRERDVVSDYDMLVGLIETRKEFAYREGERTWRLHATDFVWWPRMLTIDGKTYQGTFILTAREVR